MNQLLSCSVAVSTIVGLISLYCPSAHAQSVVIAAMNRGWYDNSGSHNLFSSTENYFVGDYGEGFRREFRNFFFFDLAGVSQPIGSAKLVLRAGNFYDSFDPSENYELHDVTTPLSFVLHPPLGLSVPTFDDFGSGVVYGSRTMTAADRGTLVQIELNSSAIAAMNGTHGPFGIGGSLTTLDSLQNLESVFGGTGSSQYISELRLTLVPEPSILLLLVIGGSSLLGLRAKRH